MAAMDFTAMTDGRSGMRGIFLRFKFLENEMICAKKEVGTWHMHMPKNLHVSAATAFVKLSGPRGCYICGTGFAAGCTRTRSAHTRFARSRSGRFFGVRFYCLWASIQGIEELDFVEAAQRSGRGYSTGYRGYSTCTCTGTTEGLGLLLMLLLAAAAVR